VVFWFAPGVFPDALKVNYSQLKVNCFAVEVDYAGLKIICLGKEVIYYALEVFWPGARLFTADMR
jgi:hypothetical protein